MRHGPLMPGGRRTVAPGRAGAAIPSPRRLSSATLLPPLPPPWPPRHCSFHPGACPMIFVTLTLPLGALLLMHAMQLLETWALHEAPRSKAGTVATARSTGEGGDLRHG